MGPEPEEIEIDIEMQEIQITRDLVMSQETAADNGSEPQIRAGDLASSLVMAKHREYATAARRFRYLYWATRLVAGLAASLLPFVISASAPIATGLSVAIVISVVIDSVFDPKSRYQIYSRASNLLDIAQSDAI